MSSIDSDFPDGTRTHVPAWITVDLLDRTRELWSKRYGRPIDTREAVDMLVRVGKLLDLLCVKPAARTRATASHR